MEVVTGCLDSIWEDSASRLGLIFYDKGCALQHYFIPTTPGLEFVTSLTGHTVFSRFRQAFRCLYWSCVGLRYLRYRGWALVGRVRRFVHGDDEGLLYSALCPHITHDFGWLRRVVNCRSSRSRHFFWRAQHKHTTVGETKTPKTGKVYPHI